jgi:hypothetical protein
MNEIKISRKTFSALRLKKLKNGICEDEKKKIAIIDKIPIIVIRNLCEKSFNNI